MLSIQNNTFPTAMLQVEFIKDKLLLECIDLTLYGYVSFWGSNNYSVPG